MVHSFFDRLRRMWEVMFECHKLQVHIITSAFSNGSVKLSLESESRRHITQLLEEELGKLSSSFTKWNNALKSYIQAIDDWLNKCVIIQEKTSKKRRWGLPLERRLRFAGPPIYTTCGVWHDTLKELSVTEVEETIKGLATEISRFVPLQDGKKTRKEAEQMHTHEPFEEWNTSYDQFQSSFVIFLNELCKFADRSLNVYSELQTNIEESKRNYEHKMSQP